MSVAISLHHTWSLNHIQLMQQRKRNVEEEVADEKEEERELANEKEEDRVGEEEEVADEEDEE